MFFLKLVIEAHEEETAFSFATAQERVDVHILSTEEFKDILRKQDSGEGVGTENFSLKKSDVVTIKGKITPKHIVYYKIKALDYTLATNAFLAQIGGL